tara:strand:+ start:1783 stop:2532 length:750 start_codon:yes stop_codon:yes gene_type:complete
MSNTQIEGCPRCDDYDEVVEELKNEKGKREKDTKDALSKCESKRKHLEKKLLTVGVIAIIAGTILGKDFVDKIADYINSFNKVKNAATSLTSSIEPVTPNTVAKKDDTEEDNEDDILDSYAITPAPRVVDTSMWPAGLITEPISTVSLITSGMLDMMPLESILYSPNANIMLPYDAIQIHSSEMLYDLTSFTTIPNELIEAMYMNERHDLFTIPAPYGSPIVNTPFVPETSTLGVLGIPLFALNKRRRR